MVSRISRFSNAKKRARQRCFGILQSDLYWDFIQSLIQRCNSTFWQNWGKHGKTSVKVNQYGCLIITLFNNFTDFSINVIVPNVLIQHNFAKKYNYLIVAPNVRNMDRIHIKKVIKNVVIFKKLNKVHTKTKRKNFNRKHKQ